MALSALDAIRQRVSINRFDPAHVLDEGTIRELVAYATEAPSSYNVQNWRFIAVRSAHAKRTLMTLANGQEKVVEAAVTFIVCGLLEPHRGVRAAMLGFHDDGHIDREFLEDWVEETAAAYQGQPSFQRDEAVRSASLAAMSLMIAAQAMGLASGPMIGFDAPAVTDQFGLKSTEIPVMLVAVGRPAEGNWPRKRRLPVDRVLKIV